MQGYGRELFYSFVPGAVRDRPLTTPLLSSALLARHGRALRGPVIELSLCHPAALTGAFRACRTHDAIVAVSVDSTPRRRHPQAARHIVDEILAAAHAAHLDRPLLLVARASDAPAEENLVDRLAEQSYRDVEAGFTAVSFAPARFGFDVEALARLARPALEQDLGIEVEIEPGDDAALALARIDDAGLSLSAVRGAAAHDEIGAAMLVMAEALAPVEVPSRVIVDATLAYALQGTAAGSPLASLSTSEALRVEMRVDLALSERLRSLKASGTASRLLDVLANSLRDPQS